MRIAVLGTDPDILALVAAAKSLGHEIAWLGDVRPAEAAQLAALSPGLPVPSTDWEMLLDQASVEAVLVGRGLASAELRAEQIKRMATDAVPMLVVHPICDSVLTYYEVDMIRRETRCLVQHYNPLTSHPVLADMTGWVRDGHPEIGTIHQVSCERHLADTLRENVLNRLARDVEMLAAVAGDVRRATAAGPRIDENSFAALQVQLTTANPASLRWSVAPWIEAGDAVELALIGERGQIILHAPDAADSREAPIWSIEQRADRSRQQHELSPLDVPSAAINRLAAAVAEPDAEHRAATSTWDKATQSMEVVDAIELSLQKGRTIEVHQQQLTEQLAFRGTMAAIGCGLLLVGFAVLVFATLMGGIEGVVDRKLIPAWPIILLAVLALFLLLQALPLLIPKTRRDAKPDDAGSPPL
jgi:predicted dehydrogenase